MLAKQQTDEDEQHELLFFDDFDRLWSHLRNPNEKYFGEVTCTGFYSSYFFAGNDQGYIRVFDLKSKKIQDLKPLVDKSVLKDKVMCIDLNLTHPEFLLAGYASGAVALFDMQSYKLIKVVNELHGSEVLAAKIYFVD